MAPNLNTDAFRRRSDRVHSLAIYKRIVKNQTQWQAWPRELQITTRSRCWNCPFAVQELEVILTVRLISPWYSAGTGLDFYG